MRGYLAVAALALYFSTIAWPGLWSGFDHDDLMNTTFTLRDGWGNILKGNVLFFSTEYRPLGSLFYRALFDVFGLNSVPFRLVGLACVALNVYLLYRLTRILAGSAEAGLYAAVLIVWHGNLAPLFLGSGNIYDVLGFLFYLAALGFYARARQRGIPGARQLLILALLHICALNSKEFAATLPLVLLALEVIFYTPRGNLMRWPVGEGRGVLLTGLVSAIYAIGKVFGPNSLTAMDAYAPRLSPDAWLRSAVVFINDLTYQTSWTTTGKVAVGALGLIAIPLFLRNRVMLFAAALSLLGPLPVMLVAPRGLASHYLTVGGLTIWVAALLLQARVAFSRLIHARAWEVSYLQSLLFTLVLLYVHRLHGGEVGFQTEQYWKENQPIADAVASVRRHPEWFSEGRRILVLSDPFGDNEWAVIFTGILAAKRYDFPIYRLQNLNKQKDADKIASSCNLFLKWQDRSFVEVPKQLALP